MDDYDAQKYIRQQLCKIGQNYRRIKFNIHIWGLQFDGGIVSNSGNPVLVWNFLGKSQHQSESKHLIELKKRGIKEFEVPLSNQVRMKLAVKELVEYVKYRRENTLQLKSVSL